MKLLQLNILGRSASSKVPMYGSPAASISRVGLRDDIMKDTRQISETLVYDNFDNADTSRRFLAHSFVTKASITFEIHSFSFPHDQLAFLDLFSVRSP
jgi:hypothetical protein